MGKAIGPGRDRDAALPLLVLFYFAVGVFSDSNLQGAILKGSIYENPELRQQVKDFARRLTRGLLNQELRQ